MIVDTGSLPKGIGSVEHHAEVCVVGGGMSGICAAIASARRGAKTILIHDRPVYGGNASSEVRMWICGAHGKFNREMGLLEEIQLENAYRNHALNYSVWDSVLYEKVHHQPNLTPLLNASVCDAEVENQQVGSVLAWQLTSQTWHRVHADYFIDCSGDSILAPLTGADWTRGREPRSAYDEDIQPEVGDDKTMGNSLLLQLRRTDRNQPFTAPRWAYRFDGPEDLPFRINGVQGQNFWWIEVGGLQDTIADAEVIRDELMKVVWGVWDYIKNRAPQRDEARKWAVQWVGSLPGKRENRRYLGAHVLTQNDIRDEGRFEDTVAYGGWSMDDHHPAGIYYPKKPTIFHPAPSPYGIPYRSLYSRNIRNLFMAGRNISVTHAALSSTRVMATCAVIGQAVGTAAAQCVRDSCEPGALASGDALRKLQHDLMDDDCWLPGFSTSRDALIERAELQGSGEDLPLLHSGLERDREDASHAATVAMGGTIEYRWDRLVNIAGYRMVLDSNLNQLKQMPCMYPQDSEKPRVPSTMLKGWRVEVQDVAGQWSAVDVESENYQRLVKRAVPCQGVAMRLTAESSWGKDAARVFAFEPVSAVQASAPVLPARPTFVAARAAIAEHDLADPPHEDQEKKTQAVGRGA